MKNRDLIKNFPSVEKQKIWDAKLDAAAVDKKIEAEATARDSAIDAKIGEFKKTNDTALKNKVDKVKGMALSHNDFSDEYKGQLDTLKTTIDGSKVTQDESRRFVTDIEKADWSAKETTEGSQAKATQALTDAKAYADGISNTLDAAKLDNASSDELGNLTLTAKGQTKATLKIAKAATKDNVGLVKIGDRLSVTEDGVLSADITKWADIVGKEEATSEKAGLMSATDKTKLDGISGEIDSKLTNELAKKFGFAKVEATPSKRLDSVAPGTKDLIFYDKEVEGSEIGRITLPKGFSGKYEDLANAPVIVNDLVTNEANKILSAAQGVELKKLIDNISNGVDQVHTHANLDELNKIKEGDVAKWDAVVAKDPYSKEEVTAEAQRVAQIETANLVDTAPETLNTLNELAAALNDDPNFATTITNQIATHEQKCEKDITKLREDAYIPASPENEAELASLASGDIAAFKALYSNDTVDEKDASTLQAAKEYADEQLRTLHSPLAQIKVLPEQFSLVDGLQKATVKHNLNTENIIVEAVHTADKTNELVSYKIVDANTIEVEAEDNEGLSLIIMAAEIRHAVNGAKIEDEKPAATDVVWSADKISKLIDEKIAEALAAQKK